jgi:hypothetical protein
MIDICNSIVALYPQVTRIVGEDAFDINGSPVQYDRALVEIEAQRMSAQQARAAAYAAEADPLFFKAQRGEATIEEWQSTVADIRARFPYPNEEVTS